MKAVTAAHLQPCVHHKVCMQHCEVFAPPAVLITCIVGLHLNTVVFNADAVYCIRCLLSSVCCCSACCGILPRYHLVPLRVVPRGGALLWSGHIVLVSAHLQCCSAAFL
jgi:hypothetical protein